MDIVVGETAPFDPGATSKVSNEQTVTHQHQDRHVDDNHGNHAMEIQDEERSAFDFLHDGSRGLLVETQHPADNQQTETKRLLQDTETGQDNMPMETQPGDKCPVPGGATLYEEGLLLVEAIVKRNDLKAAMCEQDKHAHRAHSILLASPTMRNALMGLPPQDPPVGLESVIAFHTAMPRSQEEFLGNDIPPGKRHHGSSKGGGHSRRATMLAQSRTICLQVLRDDGIQAYCKKCFPLILLQGLDKKPSFMHAILGEELNPRLTMMEIFRRLGIAEGKIRRGESDLRKLSELGRCWMPGLESRDSILSKIETSWQDFFVRSLSKRGYLDVLAGVHLPGQMKEAGLSAKTSFADGRMLPNGGGVLQWSTCFSPGFMEYFQDALETTMFLEEPSQNRFRNGFVRCESPNASRRNAMYFQVGLPPRAALYRAVESTKFGDAILSVCNYVESQRYNFFFRTLQSSYGSDLASRFTPPQKKYDLLFSVVGRKSFAFHSDSNHFLCDEGRGGFEEKLLRATTVFFQNIPTPGVTELQYRLKASKVGKVVTKLPLGSFGIHEQGNFVQDRYQHKCRYAPELPSDFRRLVLTARSTGGCQESGLDSINSKQTEIPVFQKYQSKSGAQIFYPPTLLIPEMETDDVLVDSARTPDGVGDGLSEEGDGVLDSDVESLVSHGFSTTEESMAGSQEPVHESLNFAPSRVMPKSYNPPPPSLKLIELSESVSMLLTGLEGTKLLWEKKINLMLSDERGTQIPYGPCPLFSNKNVIAPIGSYLEVDKVCCHYNIPPWTGQSNPPCSSKLSSLNAIIVSKRYKASVEQRGSMRSPAQEAINVEDGFERQGFYMYLSGGSAKEKKERGGKDVESHGVIQIAPRAMTLVNNHRNLLIAEASMQGRVVAVFVADQNLPTNKRFDSDGRQICTYAGLYEIQPVEVCQPWDARQILSVADGGIPGMDPIPIQHLTFLLCRHLRCELTPVETPLKSNKSWSGWHTLTLPYQNHTRLTWTVPGEFALKDFASPDSPILPTRREILDQFLDDLKPKPACATLDGLRGVWKKKTLAQACDILKRILVSYSMRVSAINVLGSNQSSVGCLCDIPQQCGRERLSNYHRLLGDGTIRYCAILGRNAQIHAYACPFATGDANRLFLQLCNMGDCSSLEEARLSRSGRNYLASNREEASNLFLQCIISEISGHPGCNLRWWLDYKHRKGLQADLQVQLPKSPFQVEDYLDFIERFLAVESDLEMEDLFVGQHAMNAKLADFNTFRAILLQVAKNLDKFVEEILMESDGVLERLRASLSSCTSMDWDLFHVARVMDALADVVHNPFGVDTELNLELTEIANTGFSCVNWGCSPDGGVAGAYQVFYDHVKQELEQGNSPQPWFGYLCLDEGKQICVKVNGKPLSTTDFIHILCIFATYMEREPSGRNGRSSASLKYNRKFFPFKGTELLVPISGAKEVIAAFKTEVHRSRAFYYFHCDERLLNAKKSTDVLAMYGKGKVKSVYINEEIASHPSCLPPHEYFNHIFISKAAWCSKKEDMKGRSVRMSILENDGTFGIKPGSGKSVFFEDIIPGVDPVDLPMIVEARRVHASLCNNGMAKWSNFCDSFTLHAQTEESSKDISAYYYHRDKPLFTNQVMLIFPIQGVSYFFVGGYSHAVDKMDDSRHEFEEWRLALPKKSRDKVDSFVMGFQRYAAKYKQDRMYVFKLCGGNAVALDTTGLVHGVVVPKQEKGTTRQVLIFHPMQLH